MSLYDFYFQGKKIPQEVSDGEIPKFDGAGYDKDLVEALERDIVSRNPSIHWYEDFLNSSVFASVEKEGNYPSSNS